MEAIHDGYKIKPFDWKNLAIKQIKEIALLEVASDEKGLKSGISRP